MTEIRISPEELPDAIRRGEEERVRILKAAAVAAAQKLRLYLVRETDRLKITDLGTYKNSFVVVITAVGATVVNNAPHAGIIELGARPHKVSLEGVQAIAGWVRRKLRDEKGRKVHSSWRVYNRDTNTGQFTGGTHVEDDAMSIAWAIAKAIEKRGQPPRYVMLSAMPMAREFFAQELERLSR